MKKVYLFFMFFLMFFSAIYAQKSWDLEKDKNGIKVFNRKIDHSKLKEFKGTVVVSASVDEVVEVLTNYKLHDQFVYKAKKGSVKLIKKNQSDIYTYMVIETPWPATNRDIVTLYRINPPQKDGTVVIDVEAANELKPTQKGLVRVEEMKGYWEVAPAGPGKSKITHQAYSKPGGKVPDGLANSASVSAPFDMLNDLRKLVE